MNAVTTPNRCLLLVQILLLATSGTAWAQSCDAYFPFDDDLLDHGRSGIRGVMIASGGGSAAPQFSAGKAGQALHITGRSAMRAPIDLNYETCPRFTVMAWVRVGSVDVPDNQYILSTGIGNGPAIRVQGSGVILHGTENGLYQPGVIRDPGSWYFVAGSYDYVAGTYRLEWGGHTVEGTLSEWRGTPNPVVWIGAFDDTMSEAAQDVLIDDLRIVSRALTAQEIRAAAGTTETPASMETPVVEAASPAAELPACEVHEDCATGSYCAFDGTCHPDSHRPRTTFELATVDTQVDPEDIVLADGARTETELVVSELTEEYFHGTWCIQNLPTDSETQRAKRAIRMGPNGTLWAETRVVPGVFQPAESWSWQPQQSSHNLTIGYGMLDGLPLGHAVPTVTFATQSRFVGSGRTYLRGACDASEEFPADSILPKYFVGEWCVTSSTIPGEPNQPKWRHFYYDDGRLGGDGLDSTSQWIWQQQNARMGLASGGITTQRYVQAVTPVSFQWGTSSHRSYTRGACP